jgi:hypothetical protein
VCFKHYENKKASDHHEEKVHDTVIESVKRSKEHMKSLHENWMKQQKSRYKITKKEDLHMHLRKQLKQATGQKLLESSSSAKKIAQSANKTHSFRRSIYIDKPVECNDSFTSNVSTPLYEKAPRYN